MQRKRLDPFLEQEAKKQLRSLVEEAYLLGYSDALVSRAPCVKRRRAPRGLIPSLIKQVLSETPGQKLKQIEDRVIELDGRVARRSIYGELTLHEGRFYRREGGPRESRWYLCADHQERAAGGRVR